MTKKFSQAAILLFITSFVLIGCRVQYVADYDDTVYNEIISVAKEIDMFYTILLSTSAEERLYENFIDEYLTIEVDLRSLLMRNEIRSLNEESTRQTEIALELWLEDKSQHKENNSVSDFIITQHRKQFQRIFVAMATGESAKEDE
jgi:hypothetical protein